MTTNNGRASTNIIVFTTNVMELVRQDFYDTNNLITKYSIDSYDANNNLTRNTYDYAGRLIEYNNL